MLGLRYQTNWLSVLIDHRNTTNCGCDHVHCFLLFGFFFFMWIRNLIWPPPQDKDFHRIILEIILKPISAVKETTARQKWEEKKFGEYVRVGSRQSGDQTSWGEFWLFCTRPCQPTWRSSFSVNDSVQFLIRQ
jgi:hypothetical protein